MKKTIALFTFFLSLTFNGIACLNGDSKILKNGSFLYEDSKVKIPYGHSFFPYADNYKSTFREIDSNLPQLMKDITGLTNFGEALIQIKYAFSNYHKSETSNPIPTHLNRANYSLNINNTSK